MTEQLQIEVTVRDEQGREINRFTRTLPAAGGSPMAALFQAHHAEAMHNYRLYGTLRAQIAWMPAVIAMAIISYAAERMVAASLWVNMAPTVFLLAVFLLIYLANRSLQKDQRTALGIARVARRYWVEALRHGETGPLAYADLRAIAGSELGRFRADAASKLLLGFLLSLLIAQALFALWDACWQAGASRCAV